MTKRYNAFNYIETWIGIILIPVCAFICFLPIRSIFLNSDLSLFLKILIAAAVVFLYCFLLLPRFLAFIREGQKKAFDCSDGYILGRVHAREKDYDYMVHHLDCVHALQYCNRDDCYHCPYRISCKYTQSEWLVEGSRNLFQHMEPCEEIDNLSTIIDRFLNCERTECATGCSYFDECVESDMFAFLKKLHAFFAKNGITSSEQIKRGDIYATSKTDKTH